MAKLSNDEIEDLTAERDLSAMLDAVSKADVSELAQSDFEAGIRYFRGKWKCQILLRLFRKDVMRYGEIKKIFETYRITNNVLAAALKEMERDGLLERRQYNEVPPRVEYALTDSAKEFLPILLQFVLWVRKHREAADE